MKNMIMILVFMALVNILAAQNIIKVNNMVGVTDLDYNNIDSAIANAQAGDIIMVYGTATNYGQIHIDKPVKIIGPGFHLTENPQVSIVGASAKIDDVHFQSGAAGSSIEGLEITDDVFIQTDSIVIKRCYIASYLSLGGRDRVTITQSYVGAAIRLGGSSNVNDLLVSNSIINTITEASSVSPYTISGLFHNNIISGTDIPNRLPVNSLYTNNIFTHSGVNSSINNTPGVNIFKNNLFAQSGSSFVPDSTVTGNIGNIIGVNVASLFVGITGNSSDGRYQLQAGSPAIGAGLNGVDCGIFGGATPYVLSGIPAIPNIYELTAPIQTLPNGTLPIMIKLKTNN